MFERFTAAARQVVVTARSRAEAQGAAAIGPEHLLLGILHEPDSVAVRVLRAYGVDLAASRADAEALTGSDADALHAIGIDLAAVRRRIEEEFGPGALEPPRPSGPARWFRRRPGPRFRSASKKVLELSLREALHLGHDYIGTEHLLLGLLASERDPAARLLHRRGVPVDRDLVRDLVRDELRRVA